MNQIKINRAKMIAKCGPWHLTWEENLAKVPASVVTNCSARVLANVVDALYEQFQLGQEDAVRLLKLNKALDPGPPPTVV